MAAKIRAAAQELERHPDRVLVRGRVRRLAVVWPSLIRYRIGPDAVFIPNHRMAPGGR